MYCDVKENNFRMFNKPQKLILQRHSYIQAHEKNIRKFKSMFTMENISSRHRIVNNECMFRASTSVLHWSANLHWDCPAEISFRRVLHLYGVGLFQLKVLENCSSQNASQTFPQRPKLHSCLYKLYLFNKHRSWRGLKSNFKYRKSYYIYAV